MKRVTSILLLAIFFFNVGGYYGVFWGLCARASQELMLKLDSGGYATDETIVIKVPISLPYPMQSQGYERINGSFEYKNQYYKLVKQKIEADTLYMVCINDKKEEKLQRALSDYTKISNDLPGSLSKAASGVIGKLLTEFNTQYYVKVENHVAGWCACAAYSSWTKALCAFDHPVVSPPPWC